MTDYAELPRTTNQARGLAEYAIEFLKTDLQSIDSAVIRRLELFYRDSVACAVSAIALKTNAPTVLRQEALEYQRTEKGACIYGSSVLLAPEKAILANSSAAREWDSNGTNFGYNEKRGFKAGEFGHNDFYPVALAAGQVAGLDGKAVLLGMLLIDEIRGRLAEVYSLKDKKIDHVLHGGVASAVVYGAMLGAGVDEIESGVGQFCSHFVPFRAIRHGKQLSDSKGASAAISTEAAIICMQRAMRGFIGPKDIFRNPEAPWCLFEKCNLNESPFDLFLAKDGSDFAIMDMHFKIGLYEHQSAGALQGLLDILSKCPEILNDIDSIEKITVSIYEPAFHIICDPAKWTPDTRQSADHSLPYIVSTLFRKAIQAGEASWKKLMLMPDDYSDGALKNSNTLALMKKIEIRHGGADYDAKYPEGIPTSLSIEHKSLGNLESGLVMFPEGHARNTSGNLEKLVEQKYRQLAGMGVEDIVGLEAKCVHLAAKSVDDVREMTTFRIKGA